MSKKYNGFDKDRRKFLLTATAITGAVGISVAGIPFVTSMKPSEKAKAAGASVAVDTSKIEKGSLLTTEWRDSLYGFLIEPKIWLRVYRRWKLI